MSEERIQELEARIALLEAAVKTGKNDIAHSGNSTEYAFISQLYGEDKMQAQELINENQYLKAKVDELTNIIAQRDYRIKHLKENLMKYIQ